MARLGEDCQGNAGRFSGPKMSQKDEKAERLAAALRENLRRRKAQAREMDGSKTEKEQED